MAVSRETADLFAIYVDLLARWQSIKNLVGPSTLPEVWTRHIADSHQLVALAPDARVWTDMGSGAGFPGLVVAIEIRDRPGAQVHLIESNNRKAAFLREVARETGAPVVVHPRRIEDVVPDLGAIDVLTARALAPLPQLFLWGKRLIDAGTLGLFLKGEEIATESATVAEDPAYAIDFVESVTPGSGRIVRVRAVDAAAGREEGNSNAR
ncbi:16S rRNA (guanine(527)-N(7))-methyltransferase RsmG [Lichenifustis flavocetrariae]